MNPAQQSQPTLHPVLTETRANSAQLGGARLLPSRLDATPAPDAPLQFSLALPPRRPLLPMKVVMVLLDRSEDKILELIGNRTLRFAFDVARVGAGRMCVTVWRGSVAAYRQAGSLPKDVTFERVVADILPSRPSLRAVELKDLLGSVSPTHISNLIEDGLLKTDPQRPVPWGVRQSSWVLRSSVVEFLKIRQIT